MRARLREWAPALSLTLTAASCWIVGIATPPPTALWSRETKRRRCRASPPSTACVSPSASSARTSSGTGARRATAGSLSRRRSSSPDRPSPGPSAPSCASGRNHPRGAPCSTSPPPGRSPASPRCSPHSVDRGGAGHAGGAGHRARHHTCQRPSRPAAGGRRDHPRTRRRRVSPRAAPAGDHSLDRHAADRPEPVPGRPARGRPVAHALLPDPGRAPPD